jgi:hypothetical protein
MKVNVTLEIDRDARRGINIRYGRPGLASHEEVADEIRLSWRANCDDYADEVVLDSKRENGEFAEEGVK